MTKIDFSKPVDKSNRPYYSKDQGTWWHVILMIIIILL